MKAESMKLNRRQFLKLAGAAGVLALPSVLGYKLVSDAQGEALPSLSPYAPTAVMEGWPASPQAASPILLLVDERAENPFGLYLAEILRAEGLNCFQIARLSELDSAPLDWYDLVLLTEMSLSQSQVDELEGFVARGGGLVAMRPAARLAALFGIEWTGGSTAEGYVQVAASHPVGQGIANETLQFHGVADHYRLAGAEAVAWLLSDADTRTDFPSVTVYRYGRGQAALWAFDLARSVAYTRQGNPAWAGQERDGEERIRASDMFKGWVDLDRIAIPQADEQQRLLVNLLSVMNQEKRPLPRLWYFPGAAESVLVATGDSHYNPASAIEDVLSRVEQRQGTMSIYYAPFPTQNPRRAVKRAVLEAVDLPLIGDILASQFTSPGPSHVAEWRARGHEFALHPYVDEVLEEGWLDAWQEFTGVGYGPVSPSVRTHRVLWTGWVETARYQASLGIRMNLDYYHWGAAFQYAEGKWANGHFTGSGRPLRFVDEQGNILNIYQQLTQLTDEQLIDLPWGEGAKMGAEKALEVTQAMLARSVAGNYCAIATNFHVDPFAFGGEWVAEAARLLEGTLDYAAAQNIPILTAVKWLDFTETRDGANLENVQWYASGQRVSFELRTTRDQDAALTVMIPQRHKEIELVQIEIDGVAVEHRRRNVGGMEYGWVVVPAGSHQIVATFS